MTKRREAWLDALIAAALAVVYVVVLLRTLSDLGYARDEGFYFQAASTYGRWFDLLLRDWHAAMAQSTVDAHWRANSEHPALIKSLFALSNLFLEKRHHLFAMGGTSYRFPTMLLSGLGVALVYVWGRQARGRVAGLAAAGLLAAMPRFFYHAHLACFDAPIVTMWTLAAYCYWRALRDGGWLWPILTGVTFGLALDTKHNAWFLPILFVAHFIAREILHQAANRLDPGPVTATRERDFRASRRRALAAGAMVAILGPLVFYALWPWIWHDTRARLSAYASFHLHHEYYNMEFLGHNYWAPPMPRAYAWVMTAATVPGVTLLLFFAGLAVRAHAHLARPVARLLRRSPAGIPRPRFDPASTDLLWLLAIGANMGAWLSPETPIFGGTKHWMTAYPFVALFAGTGVAAAVRVARREILHAWGRRMLRYSPGVAALMLVAVLAAPIAETAHSHPWGLSSYSPLVGGAAGGATLGLNRSFWGYTTGAVTGYLNREVPPQGTVYVHDTAGPSWDMLATDGRLRRDVRGVWSIAGADFGLYHHEMHMRGQEFQAWVAFGTVRPDAIAGIDGVPVILVYRKR